MLPEIDRLKNESELLAVKMKLAQSENAYLQQQMNPHMLFNSLAFIHSTVYKISHEAAENVILLTDILRFSIEETDADGKIQLSSEAEQIENMIKINAYRFDHSLRISYIIEGDLTGHKIIPLVLMTLTENIFKHRRSAAERSGNKVKLERKRYTQIFYQKLLKALFHLSHG